MQNLQYKDLKTGEISDTYEVIRLYSEYKIEHNGFMLFDEWLDENYELVEGQ